jgi:hypothetical protein
VVRGEITEALKKEEGALSEIVKALAKKYDLPRNMIYDEALKLKREAQKE